MATTGGCSSGCQEQFKVYDPSTAKQWSSMLLTKDEKPICHAKLLSLAPFTRHSTWVIIGFQKKRSLPSSLSCLELLPEPKFRYQVEEWKKFLKFLHDYQRAAIIKDDTYDIYVLSPDRGCEHAIVSYRRKSQHISENEKPKAVSSARKKNEEEKPCSLEQVATAKKNVATNSSFVRADPSYLLTLGQAHAGWAFGAIAELVDNSRDANAKRLDISIESCYCKREGKEIPVLSVIDDGQGMFHQDMIMMLSFGRKQPDTVDADHIGRFGIGFKTGAMKLGRDVIVFTQTSGSRSVALLSQSFNGNKDNIEIPVITYSKRGQFMEVDLGIQSEETANENMKAIKEYTPFNEFLIGEMLGKFGIDGKGTQIYIWNLEKWGSSYTLEWDFEEMTNPPQSKYDILIRSRRTRSRPGQISQKVPLDYSLRAYLEVIFIEPRMKIYVQGSLVKSRPLAKSLRNTCVIRGVLMDKAMELVLGRSQVEWERANCGLFLYWHGRLIEAYKRVGGMVHNADMGRGVIGVIDVSGIMTDDKNVWVHNNKQGFLDCEALAKLEEWLGHKIDEYWDDNYDRLKLAKVNDTYKLDNEWVQCDKCRKWRMLTKGFDTSSLPSEWFCYMPPYNGNCGMPEQKVDTGVVIVGARRSGFGIQSTQKTQCAIENLPRCSFSIKPGQFSRRVNNGSTLAERAGVDNTRHTNHNTLDDSDAESTETDVETPVQSALKRLCRGPPRTCR